MNEPHDPNVTSDLSGAAGSPRPADTILVAGPELSAPPANPPGYELLDEIGRGGMGVVYRARDTALSRDVAVKLLSERYPPDSPAAQRFLSEARITGQLQHPGIPAVHQVGTLADGRPFLAMKLIKGNTLEAILKQRSSPLPISPEGRGEDKAADRGRLLAIFEALCQALGYAHAHRVIHRDLKPANVMVGAFGEVQVMDWGLAKVLDEETPATEDTLPAEQTKAWTQVSPTPESGSQTQAGSLIGTPAFIAPEQAVGQIERVNERSDVFGLGALLAVILTDKPPYVGETGEAVRVLAVRGKLEDCFARLDASGAEPELVALCKKCLAFESADRPADAGTVAAAVAGLRAAADERARRAELERVRVEGEQATALARSAERRKRRRLALLAAAVLAVAAVSGLTAVLAVQRQANADLAAKNRELADEQAKVQTRFELAQKAIALFHTGVSEDALLKNPQFKELRTRLLNEAAGFYADLQKLLEGQTDAKSRKALAEGYFQLAELTDKIGDPKQALAVHRQALAVRRELAAAPGADVQTRLDVACSLEAVGRLLRSTGAQAQALSAFQEEHDLAAALEAESPTDAVRAQLAFGLNCIGFVLDDKGKRAEALDYYRKALAIYQTLPEDGQYPQPGFGPTFGLQLQTGTYMSIGLLLSRTGKPADGLEALRKASDILEKLAKANPANNSLQQYLADSYELIANVLMQIRRPAEALEVSLKALAIFQKLADDNPAVTAFQVSALGSRVNVAINSRDVGRLSDAIKLLEETLPAIKAKMPDHEYAFNCMGALADFYAEAGRTQEAIKLREETLQLCKAKLGPDHPGTLGGMVNLANSYQAVGRLTDAIELLEEALPVMKAKMPDHQFTFNCMGSLAGSYAKAGRTLEALKLREGMLELYKAKLGSDHPETLGSMTDVAISYADAGRTQDALKLREEILPLMKAKQGPDHPNTLGSMVNLAGSYQAVGRLTDAIKLLEEALPVMKAKMPDHQFTFNCMYGLANAYTAAGRTQEALDLCEEILRLKKTKLGPDHRDTLAALDRASMVYLTIAARQAWSGQQQEWTAVCERALSLAQDTKIALVADRVAKACSLRPSNDKTHQAALLLARRAVELGEGHRFLAYFQMALGMAEYRSGRFAEADSALTAAIEASQGGDRYLAGTSAFYQAMSLFRQGKQDEARQLATQAVANMKPLPEDDKNPLAGGANADDLILWMAYKEAKDLIKFDATPASAERLRAVLKGEASPKDNTERLSLARMCEQRKLFAAAARLLGEALESDSKLGDDIQNRTRHQATGRAVLAGVGQGEDDPRPDEAGRNRWRSQACDWFRADLRLYAKTLESGNADDRRAIANHLEHWKVCPDLAPVRDPEARQKLPEAERKEWQALWEEVEALLKRAQEREKTESKL
jgi:serine/threonine protein kinase